jgi:hypothetical protein
MSLKNPKHLLIIGAVVVALMVGTVLLANYANILPAGSDADSQVEASPATGQTPCPGAKAFFAENANVECARKTEAGSDAKVCPFGRTEPCCAGEAKPGCCPKVCPPGCTKPCCEECCPPDCTKPCCAEETTTGCCPMSSPSATTNSGCCPKTSTATE